jgi:hypothetical protein
MTNNIGRHPHFGPLPLPHHKLCKAHGWRLDHRTEDCFALWDLRRDLANKKNIGIKGINYKRRQGRANLMDANTNLVKGEGDVNVNSTMAGAFERCIQIPLLQWILFVPGQPHYKRRVHN